MIRSARPDDEPSVRRIVFDAYSHYIERIGREPGPMGDDYAARIDAGQVWVAEEGGEIAGLVVIEHEGDSVLLDNIAVSPHFQGQGHGRALMEFVEARARADGATSLRLYTHIKMTENIALYVKIGFVETGRVREHGFDRVYMTKSLGA